jgi:hypothetical protein
MSDPGQKRRFDCQPMTSGLPLINGHSQSRSACLKGANFGSRPTDVAKRKSHPKAAPNSDNMIADQADPRNRDY